MTTSEFLSFDRGTRYQRKPQTRILNLNADRVPLHPPLANGCSVKPDKPISINELKRRAKAARRKPLPAGILAVEVKHWQGANGFRLHRTVLCR
jgi:hypothetical protein